MSTLNVLVGNVVKTTITWTVDGGGTITTSTCRIQDPDGTVTNLSVSSGGTNIFTASHTIGDTDTPGEWIIRWEATAGGTGAEESVVVAEPSLFASP